MSGTQKTVLIMLGAMTALLIVSQLVMGQLILSGSAQWVKRHQHSGYLTVAVSLAYVAWSLLVIASIPPRPKA